MTARLLVAGGWLILFGIYLIRMPGTFYFEDSPELIACAQSLGNTHEPGYPLLALVGRLAMLAPLGCPAFRFNVLGAACAAGAAQVLGVLAASIALRFAARLIAVASGAFAAAVWGLSDTFWWQAMIGEKYALFYLAFTISALLAWRIARAGKGEARRLVFAAVFFWGLGLAHHLFLIFAFPLLLVSVSSAKLSGGRPARIAALALLLGSMPLSVKALYPPVRSAAGISLDWGGPSAPLGMLRYISGGRYLRRGTAEGVAVPGYHQRLGRAFGQTREELPLLLIAAAPLGAVGIARTGRWLLAALMMTAFLNVAFVAHFSERIVRWQQPAHAVLLLLAACGLAEMCQSFVRAGWARMATALMLALALLGGVVQWERGRMRNDLSGFYGAHDLGRNILLSLPRNSVYLGRGDSDLFPLWAIAEVEGSREDVVAAGLGSLMDTNPADQGMLRKLRERTGLKGSGWRLLEQLAVSSRDSPVMIAKTGYEDRLWRGLGSSAVHQARGIAGRLSPTWEFALSERISRRLFGAYSLRGVTHARQGPFRVPGNIREEIALDGLLHYADSLVSLGVQICHYGPAGCAVWPFRRAARLLSPFSGLPWEIGAPPGGSPEEEARAWASAAARGYEGLSGQFAERGSLARAARYRQSAVMCLAAAGAANRSSLGRE